MHFWFKKFIKKCSYILFSLFLLNACSTIDEENRSQIARQLVAKHHWHELALSTTSFPLRAYISPNNLSDTTLTIYIEGDGVAWIRGEYPSNDPTPRDPIGLKLALAQPSGATAYLARPCQFIESTLCNPKVWTSERFSEVVVQSTNQAISLLKSRTQAQKIILVGYSGGAAIALLVAAQRHDVKLIVSVAGNVNPHLWTNNSGMQPLVGSLDPQNFVNRLEGIPQVYLVGGQDRVIPPELAYRLMEQFPQNARPRVIEVKENGHVCCWVEQWPLLWTQIMQKAPDPQ